MTNKWAMAICVVMATLVVIPQAFALSASFGGPTGSTAVSYSSALGTSINEKNSLSAQDMSSLGNVVSDYGAGAVSKYFERTSNDGKSTAASYAFLSGSGKYKYTFTGTAGANSASTSLDFAAGTDTATATRVGNFLLGGFAYNEKDYAGTYALGRAADEIAYKNTVSASSSKVSATEKFSGKNLEDVTAMTWAERGQLSAEVLTEADVRGDGVTAGSGMWTDVVLDYADAVNYPQGTCVYLGAPYKGMDQTNNLLYVNQLMTMQSGTINSATPYTATATLSGNTASSTSKATITGGNAALASTTNFVSYALSGDLSTGYDDTTSLNINARNGASNSITYSASSKATLNSATATQTENVGKADFIQANAFSNDYTRTLNTFDNVILAGDAAAIYATLSATDTATSKSGSSSVTQKIVSSSAVNLFKNNYATNADLGYTVDADLTNGYGLSILGTAVSTLSGTTTTSATNTGASVLSTGKIKAVVGAGSALARLALADKGTSTSNLNDPHTPATRTTYLFAEKYKASSTLTQAA